MWNEFLFGFLSVLGVSSFMLSVVSVANKTAILYICGYVVSNIIIREIFNNKKQKKILSFLNLSRQIDMKLKIGVIPF